MPINISAVRTPTDLRAFVDAFHEQCFVVVRSTGMSADELDDLGGFSK